MKPIYGKKKEKKKKEGKKRIFAHIFDIVTSLHTVKSVLHFPYTSLFILTI